MSESRETGPFRDNPTEIARFLTKALAKDDVPALLDALSIVLRAQYLLLRAQLVFKGIGYIRHLASRLSPISGGS